MKKIIRITESDLTRIVRRVLKESEDDYIDLDMTKGNKDNLIKFDFKREKDKTKLKRILVSETTNTGIAKGSENFADLIYGYNDFNDKIVKARQNSKFKKDLNLNDLIISYNCTQDIIQYKGVNPTKIQKKQDMDWLGTWCNKIDWDSRVGKKKNLFRQFNPLLITKSS
jgi:hypothetical protein